MAQTSPESSSADESGAYQVEASELLRVRASIRLRGEELLTPELSVWETAKLIQELRIHQIELEMQNEELRRSQLELETSRSRYTDLYDFAPVGYLVLDKDGLITSANLAGASLLGVERGPLIGRPFFLFIHKKGQDQFHRYRRLVQKTGRRQTCELRLIRKDKAEVFVQLSGEVINHDGAENGHVRMALTDITERRKAQEEIVHLARFPSENPSPVLRLTAEGRILYANSASADLLGHWRLAEGQCAPAVWCKVVEEIMHSGRPDTREVSLDGRVFSLLFAPVRESGYVSVYGRDITRQREVEDALRKQQEHLEQLVQSRTQELSEANARLLREVKARERLQAQILHICEHERRWIGQELHDTVAQTFAGIGFLLKGFESKFLEESPDARDGLNVIRKLLSGVLKKVKNLAMGLYPVELETGGLAASLEGLASRAEHLFGVSCVLELDASFPTGKTDGAVQLYRIAQEAVINAVKHGKAKCVRITLAVEDGTGFLRVQDDGQPCPTRFEAGSRIRLQLMKYRAEIMGAQFDVRPGQTDGTIMTCTFPVSRTGDDKELCASGARDTAEKGRVAVPTRALGDATARMPVRQAHTAARRAPQDLGDEDGWNQACP